MRVVNADIHPQPVAAVPRVVQGPVEQHVVVGLGLAWSTDWQRVR